MIPSCYKLNRVGQVNSTNCFQILIMKALTDQDKLGTGGNINFAIDSISHRCDTSFIFILNHYVKSITRKIAFTLCYPN